MLTVTLQLQYTVTERWPMVLGWPVNPVPSAFQPNASLLGQNVPDGAILSK